MQHLKFVPTTHEKCPYSKRDPIMDKLQMLLHQVDDFSVSAKDKETCKTTIASIGQHLQVPLKTLELLRSLMVLIFSNHDGLWKYCVKITSCYAFSQITPGLTCLQAAILPVPMRNDLAYQKQLESAQRPSSEKDQQDIQHTAGFSYRMATEKLMYAMVTTRHEISWQWWNLHNTAPARRLSSITTRYKMCLLSSTIHGTMVWYFGAANPAWIYRIVYLSLRDDRIPAVISYPHQPQTGPTFPPSAGIFRFGLGFRYDALSLRQLHYHSGSRRRGGLQNAILPAACSGPLQNWSGICSASDASKLALYIRSLLAGLGFTQSHPTSLCIDNRGAMHMVTAGAPTKRTHHVDIRYFLHSCRPNTLLSACTGK